MVAEWMMEICRTQMQWVPVRPPSGLLQATRHRDGKRGGTKRRIRADKLKTTSSSSLRTDGSRRETSASEPTQSLDSKYTLTRLALPTRRSEAKARCSCAPVPKCFSACSLTDVYDDAIAIDRTHEGYITPSFLSFLPFVLLSGSLLLLFFFASL